MDYYQKVYWREGMRLVPQHFQQADRRNEYLLRSRLRGIQAHDWGLCELAIEEEGIAGGEFAIHSAAGALPDGSWFDLPEQDALPDSRSIEPAFPAGQETLGVHLAQIRWSPGMTESVPEESTDKDSARIASRVRLGDATDGNREEEIAIARNRMKLLFDGEDHAGYVTLKVAQIKRTATGGFELDEAYVPPSLYLSASRELQTIVRRVLEILAKKSEDLSAQRRQRTQGLVEFTMSEAAAFWLLHSVNGHIPAVLGFHHQPRQHPELVFRELATLAGELYTFAGEGHPRDLPLYDHADLGTAFAALEEKLRGLLGVVLATRCVPIPLERSSDTVFVGHVNDERLLDGAQFFLAAAADVPDEKIELELPSKTKISSKDRLGTLIAQAMRGIALQHLPTPPSEIPVQPGRRYFQVGQSGEDWDAVTASRTIAFYVPPEFTNAKLELMAVRK